MDSSKHSQDLHPKIQEAFSPVRHGIIQLLRTPTSRDKSITRLCFATIVVSTRIDGFFKS